MEQLNIVYKSIKQLKPYKKNAKKHPKEQIEQIANSIKEFGFLKHRAVAIDKENVVIEGHGRILAAKKAGLKQVPTVCIDDMTEEQMKAWRLIENKTAESGWNKKLLDEEVNQLSELFDMSSFGFGLTIDDIDIMQEGQREIAPELGEANNYIVLEFDTEQEWDEAQVYFDLKEVKTPDKNPKIRRKGIGRVIKGKPILDIIKTFYDEMEE